MTGLIGWWPLHEDSGSKAYDLSGNDNHGSLNGGVTQGVAGKGGLTAYSFSGGQSIDLNRIGETLDSLSISAWVNITDKSSVGQIFRDYADNSITLRTNNGDIEFGMNSNSSEFTSITYSVENNRWYHVVASWNGSEMRLHIDGTQVGTASWSDAYAWDTNRNPSIGYKPYNNSQYYSGTVSNVRLYDRGLSDSEIRELYEWGNGDFARPLNNENSSSAVARWAFDGDASDSWSSNDGAVNGGLSWTSDAIRGRAASFDGSSYVNLGDSEDLGSNLGEAFALSVWVRPDSGDLDGSTNDALSKGGANEWDNYQVGIQNNQFFARVGTEGSYYPKVSSQIKPAAGSWHHLVCIYDGEEIRLYVNGVVEDRNGDIAGSPNNISSAAKVGAFDPEGTQDNRYWSGAVDDVRIYSKALSPEEIFELYRWGTRGRDMRKFTVNSR